MRIASEEVDESVASDTRAAGSVSSDFGDLSLNEFEA